MAAKYSYQKLRNESSDFIFDYGSAFDYSSCDKNSLTYCEGRKNYSPAFTYNSVSSSEDSFIDCPKEPWLSIVLRDVIFYLSCLFMLLLFPVSVFFCVKRVHSLERLVVSRLGKLQPVKGPGFIFVLPFVDHWTRVDLHPKQLIVSTPEILTVDGGIVEITAEINYQVSDVLHYVTKSNNPFKNVHDLSTCSLVNIASGKDQEQLERNRETINEALKGELNKTVVKWGVEIVSISLKPVKILKAAEPVNAISTIISALKAVSDQTSLNPGIINITSATLSTQPSAKSVEPEVSEEYSHLVPILRHFITSSENKGKVKDLSAVFKLEIICSTPKIAYIVIHNGDISVFENSELEQNPDVSIVVDESCLQDILNGKIGALEAYLGGKITVSGNWTLLNTLSELLN